MLQLYSNFYLRFYLKHLVYNGPNVIMGTWQIGSEMQAILKWHMQRRLLHCTGFLNLCTLGQWPREEVSKVVTGATQRRIKVKLEKFTELKTHLGSGQLTDYWDAFQNNLFTNILQFVNQLVSLGVTTPTFGQADRIKDGLLPLPLFCHLKKAFSTW